MGFLTRVLGSSGPTHGRPPCSSLSSPGHSTHGTKPRQQPLSAWQVSYNPDQPDLPVLAMLPSALFDLE
jgi:hypothetical protein